MAVQVDRSQRLPESEYFPEPQRKSGIAIHHTVCSSARGTLDAWKKDRTPAGTARQVGTAFVVDLDGTIFEAFPPEAWAWQFGLDWPDRLRTPFEQRFIGIELVSEGPLQQHEGHLYAYGILRAPFRKRPEEILDCGTEYRGHRYFDRYEPRQLQALGSLVDDLCRRFAIPRVYPEKPYLYYGNTLQAFEGVIGHAMLRPDKSDPAPDPRLWDTLRDLAALRPIPVAPSALATKRPTPLTPLEREVLFHWNASRVNQMDVGAGSLVKNLLMELERRGVCLKLRTPEPGGSIINYDIAEGDRGEVAPVARALGFKAVSDRTLEVADA